MLTHRRFGALLDRYGAEPSHWPDAVRGEAEALVAPSAEARAQIAEARSLDAAITAATRQGDATLWSPGEADAALARLRSSVAARIAPAMAKHRPARWGHDWALSDPVGWAVAGRRGWFGLAAGCGFAVAAGLLIGAMYAPASSDDVLTMLQPAPIRILSD